MAVVIIDVTVKSGVITDVTLGWTEVSCRNDFLVFSVLSLIFLEGVYRFDFEPLELPCLYK